MSDKKKKSFRSIIGEKGTNKAGGTSLKPILIWFVIVIGMLFFLKYMVVEQNRVITVEASDFQQMVVNSNVVSAVLQSQSIEVTGVARFEPDDLENKMKYNLTTNVVHFKTSIVDSDDYRNDLVQTFSQTGVAYKIEAQNKWIPMLVTTFLPLIIVVGIIAFFLNRQMKKGVGGAMNFGKSRARQNLKGKDRITFEDLAGCEEAKEETQEIIDYLTDPKKFERLGGKIPRGVILVGPPGTGKTLLAKAVAGEAEVPFFSISGSDFVEMFVGVGAARVRDMFEQGKRSAPCIIFIDEIDAVGRQRGTGVGGGHDEREQTLNALLVEMDGFAANDGVIIIAATNRPDVLDPALLRPGRFDRQIVIDMPDQKGRFDILNIHSQKIKLDPKVDLTVIARGTPGFSGADLANLMNESALMSARHNRDSVTLEYLEEARDKVCFGRERASRVMKEKDRRITAYHEAGHALVMALIPECEPLHKVTIVPRGVAFLGATMQLPQEDKYHQTKKELEGQIASSMGGRLAEEITFGEITAGARGDIKMSSNLARRMVCEWGMSDKLGPLAYGDHEEHLFLGREIERHVGYSQETARLIDVEVRALIDQGVSRARKILVENQDRLIAIAEALLLHEVLDGSDVDKIINGEEIQKGANRVLFDREADKKRPRQESTSDEDKDKVEEENIVEEEAADQDQEETVISSADENIEKPKSDG